MKVRNLITISTIMLIIIALIPASLAAKTTRGDLLVNFINSCYKSEKGYGDFTDSLYPNIRSTYQAIKIFERLGLLHLINKEE